MTSLTRNEFLTTRAWHRAIVGGKDVILRRTSALEYLELFNGFMHEKMIDVYAKQPGEYDNINYHIVDSFDGIDYNRFDDVFCTSINLFRPFLFSIFKHEISEYAIIRHGTCG